MHNEPKKYKGRSLSLSSPATPSLSKKKCFLSDSDDRKERGERKRGKANKMPVLLLPLASFPLILALIATFFPLAVVVLGEFPAAMALQRAFPVSHPVELSQLRARDRSRHDRMLQPFGSFIDFPVNGTYNPFVAG